MLPPPALRGRRSFYVDRFLYYSVSGVPHPRMDGTVNVSGAWNYWPSLLHDCMAPDAYGCHLSRNGESRTGQVILIR